MKKILSLIIPTYNMEKYLNKCLDSLLVENMNLLEVLVINDGSKDNSSTIAHEYARKHPNTFKVIDKENGNYGSCINRGLKEATGKYIKVLDADDYFNTHDFNNYIQYLSKIDIDMIITPFTYVDKSGKSLYSTNYQLDENINLTFKEVTPILLNKHLQMHAVTYKKDILDSINYKQTEGISYTDQEWIFTPLYKVNTIVYYNKIIYMYLIGREGQTMTKDNIKRNITHNEICIKRIIKDYSSFSFEDKYKKEYLTYKTMTSISFMYKSYLIDYPDLPLINLINFDDWLYETNHQYLEEMDKQKINGTNIKYIKIWHKNRQKRFSIIACKIIHLYSKIYNKLKHA